MKTLAVLFAAACALLAAPGASAHTQSYGFLTISVSDDSVEGRLDLAVRDLDSAYDLDLDRDGKITWGEFRAREAELRAALLDGVSIGAADGRCRLEGRPALTDSRGGATYIVLPFGSRCAVAGGPVEVGYDLIFDTDAQHRALAAVTVAGVTQSVVLSPDTPRVSFDSADAGGAGLFFTFVAHGAHHIWIGYDHILFLVTLLLSAVVVRRPGEWAPVDDLKSAFFAAVKVVTSFTLAHSLTLGLAAVGVLRIPPALTESAIAATIVMAALNNIFPVVTRRIWMVAFLFGLIHGVGFANVLADLDLQREGLLTALFAFNLGVELGQLAIVAALLPLLIILGRKPVYGRVALPAASFAVAAVGAMWFVERALGLAILPGG
jgi:hypothetical protein